MTFRMFAWAFALAAVTPIVAEAQPVVPKAYPVVQGKTYKFEKIADGVYYATGGFGSNNVVIVNDDDVLLVDTGTSPANARAFVADVKLLSNKPVRYVVNTHWHFDHTDGNSIFGPDVQIIAHDYVRAAITTFDVLYREPYRTSQGTAVPAQIEDLKKQIEAEKDVARKGTLAKAARGGGKRPGAAQGDQSDPAQHDLFDQNGSSPGTERDRSDVPGTGPYRRRYGGLSSQGTDRCDR